MGAHLAVSRGYYQTMVYRLMVLGGAASRAAGNTYVVNVQQRQTPTAASFAKSSIAGSTRTRTEAKGRASQRGAVRAVGRHRGNRRFPCRQSPGQSGERFRDPAQGKRIADDRIFEVTRP